MFLMREEQAILATVEEVMGHHQCAGRDAVGLSEAARDWVENTDPPKIRKHELAFAAYIAGVRSMESK
jgi:hypothetical protein